MDKYLLAIGMLPGINSEVWQKLTTYFKSYQDAWEASISELMEAGLKEKTASNLAEFRGKFDIGKITEKYERLDIKAVTLKDKDYPEKLKEIYNPPFVLYVRGELPDNGLAIAVVGARKCTDYGRRATSDISAGLAKAGVVIVSGLALGLDTEAHKATLKNDGITVAVLANGLDMIYPASNTVIAAEIIQKSGCIVSEQPLGMPALKQNFPARNRIISGLSDGVLVTEAGEHSGTLHTANFALEQNRNVYAVPGPIYNEMAIGPNNLIKNGAKPVSSAKDILDDFGVESETHNNVPENENERLIFEVLKSEPKHIDLISKEIKKESAETSQILTLMEIKGKVSSLGGMVYTLKR